jgi:hypothetical protein
MTQVVDQSIPSYAQRILIKVVGAHNSAYFTTSSFIGIPRAIERNRNMSQMLTAGNHISTYVQLTRGTAG